MKRNVSKVIKELRKRGMTRAYIEYGGREYLYPPIDGKRKKQRNRYIIGIIIVLLITAALVIFFPSSRSGRPAPVSKAVEIDRADRYGMRELHHAVIGSDIGEVKRLLGAGARIDMQDNYGWTPLHWSVLGRDAEICRYLVSKNASLDIETRKEWFKYPVGITVIEMVGIVGDAGIAAIFETPK